MESSFQILSLYDDVDAISVDKVVEYVKGLQQEDGSFAGDKWGKITEAVQRSSISLILLIQD